MQERRLTRNLLFPILLLCGSVSISVLAAEAILRLLGYHGAPLSRISNIYHVDDPILDWRYIPNSQYIEGRTTYRYNTSGFRGSDHAVQKAPGIMRILVLGDSLTEGYGVAWEYAFSSRIQSALGPGYEVITMAAGGLNTPQEVHLLESEGLIYKPDLVILNFVLNDSDFYTNYTGAQRYYSQVDSYLGILNIPINPKIKRLLKASALIHFLKERLEHLKGRFRAAEQTDYFTELWKREENRHRVIMGFDRLDALQTQRRFRAVVVIWPLLTDFQEYRFTWIHEWVKNEANKRQFMVIDLLDSFGKVSYRELKLTPEDSIHPNALGHKIAAETYLTWYARSGGGSITAGATSHPTGRQPEL